MPIGHNKGPVPKRTPERQDDIDALKAALRSCATNKTLTYAEMSYVCSRPISSQDGSLRAALIELLREGIAFDNQPTVGYTRRDDIAHYDSGIRNVRRIHRRYKKAYKEAALCDTSKIEHSKRPLHEARLAVLSEGARTTHGNHVNSRARKTVASPIGPLLMEMTESIK